MRIFILFIGVIFIFSSCVTNKKVQYLQNDDVNKKGLVKDSVLRSYTLEPFDYKIQPNDLLSVRFESLTPQDFDFLSSRANQQNINTGQGNAQLIGELVDEQGNIPFPVVGKMKVEGLTVFQIQDKLQALANQYLESPVVKVRMLNYRFTILGEVNSEGTIVLSNNRVSMMEAIGIAGGLTDLADRTNIKLIRQIGDTTEVQYINLLEEKLMESPYYYIHQNDVLIVPPLRQRPYRKYFGSNIALVVSSISLILFAANLTK